MEYISVKEAAEKWGVSQRYAQRCCTEGRINGAVKLSGIWAVPADAEKPAGLKKTPVSCIKDIAADSKPNIAAENEHLQNKKTETGGALRIIMPLINTPYKPGSALESVIKINNKDMRNIAFAEYYYFSGRPDEASFIAENYLTDRDLAVSLSACLIYAYANIALDRISKAKQAIIHIREAAESADENIPFQYKSYMAFISITINVLLHLPLPEGIDPIKSVLPMLPTGIRLFALYIEAHGLYLGGHYAACIAVAETALALEEKIYPIPSIYLHLAAAMGYVNIKETKPAKFHLLEAWKIAQPDDMIEAFGEHHGLLGGMLESVMKKEYPDDFKRIINITYSFSAGWRKIHNPLTGQYVADDLTTTEFTVAMLAAKGWTNKEIASHLHISVNTVGSQITAVFRKLNITHRSDLSEFMLK